MSKAISYKGQKYVRADEISNQAFVNALVAMNNIHTYAKRCEKEIKDQDEKGTREALDSLESTIKKIKGIIK